MSSIYSQLPSFPSERFQQLSNTLSNYSDQAKQSAIEAKRQLSNTLSNYSDQAKQSAIKAKSLIYSASQRLEKASSTEFTITTVTAAVTAFTLTTFFMFLTSREALSKPAEAAASPDLQPTAFPCPSQPLSNGTDSPFFNTTFTPIRQPVATPAPAKVVPAAQPTTAPTLSRKVPTTPPTIDQRVPAPPPAITPSFLGNSSTTNRSVETTTPIEDQKIAICQNIPSKLLAYDGQGGEFLQKMDATHILQKVVPICEDIMERTEPVTIRKDDLQREKGFNNRVYLALHLLTHGSIEVACPALKKIFDTQVYDQVEKKTYSMSQLFKSISGRTTRGKISSESKMSQIIANIYNSALHHCPEKYQLEEKAEPFFSTTLATLTAKFF